VAEAGFMTGMERNSDIVWLAAYAPLMVHAEDHRCPTNLIVFDNHRLVSSIPADLHEALPIIFPSLSLKQLYPS